MKDPATKQRKKKAEDNMSMPDEKKKLAFERGLHNDSNDDQKENITNKDNTIVNTEEEEKVVNHSENE